MKRTKLSLALGAILCAGISGQALALDPSLYSPSTTTFDLFVSGASAQDTGLLDLMRRACASGTLDVFTGTNQAVYFCDVNTAQLPGLTLTKTRLALHKTSVGGSGNGVQPVADATQLAFIDMNQIKANPALCSATSSVAAVPPIAPDTVGLPAYTTRSCGTAGQANFVTEAGFSDVEPALFGATPAQIGKLNVASANSVIFGVPVNLDLRNALQQAQGLVVGAEDEANMPSLTKSQIASLFTGNTVSWSSFTNNGAALTGLPVDTNVYISRRVSTSGTQKTNSIYFTNADCTPGVAPFVVGNDTTNCGALAGTVGTVNEGSGSGNVIACLNSHYDNNRWAVGVLSTEFVANTAARNKTTHTGGDGWRFIKLGKVAPTLLNTVEGKYDLWSEQSTQYRNTTSPAPLTGDKLNMFVAISSNIGHPNIVTAIDSGLAHSFGNAGLLALFTNGYAAPAAGSTAAQVLANPVNRLSKSPNGFPNNCQPPVLANPVDVNL